MDNDDWTDYDKLQGSLLHHGYQYTKVGGKYILYREDETGRWGWVIVHEFDSRQDLERATKLLLDEKD
jgi:hypothetical protein